MLDESITTGRDFYAQTTGSQPHDYLGGTGGSIGWALPVGAGAAISSPERKVIVLESDGSGMYNPQSLWTYAREQLDIVVLIFANRKYQILRNEMSNVGVPDFGRRPNPFLISATPPSTGCRCHRAWACRQQGSRRSKSSIVISVQAWLTPDRDSSRCSSDPTASTVEFEVWDRARQPNMSPACDSSMASCEPSGLR